MWDATVRISGWLLKRMFSAGFIRLDKVRSSKVRPGLGSESFRIHITGSTSSLADDYSV